MKVLLLSKYPRMGASSRLRFLQYLPYLKSEGIDVTVSNLFDEIYLRKLYDDNSRPKLRTFALYLKRIIVLFTSFRYDVLWIEKELFPYLPALFERLLGRLGIRYVVDYDDAIFHNYDRSKDWVVLNFLDKKIDTVMSRATCVVAGNRYLAQRANNAGARWVEIIPTVVNYERYSPCRNKNKDSLVIGWIGSPSTQRYLVDIKKALKYVCNVNNTRLLLVGATPDIREHFEGVDVEVHPWTEETEVKSIALMDIGIMPLVDGPWEKGKCGYKLIQYMAMGVPVVASPVGVNVEIVTKNSCGLLALSERDWTQNLFELINNAPKREGLGSAGRKAVLENYSLQCQGSNLASLLKSVCR